ncbi:MAG: sulfatase [Prevotella sp.]|jgi:arylsulfatase A-like enzyme|nr:sulfatase [Prevotella sp.]
MKNINKNVSIFCALTASLASSQAQVRQDRPNIICIVTEDISPYLGCYGDAVAKTPNLDRFAQSAIRYTNMHTTVGVSSPSRFALITGMYPSALGGNFMRNQSAPQYLPEGIRSYEVVLPEGIRAYTEYMREAGYYCTNNSKTDYQFNANVAHWDENSNKATWKNCPDSMPFLSIHNIMTTHESQIWMRKDSLEIQPEDIDMTRFPYLPDDSVIRRDLARMYTNIAIMDRETQVLLDDLEASGLADNTIVIWYSDNGGPIPRGKRSIYNTGTNVPFMVRFPDGYRKGEVDNRLGLFMDIPATILSLAGIQPPEYMHGKAFLGQYAQPERDYIYGARDRFDEVIDKCGFIQDHRYQYIRNYMPQIAGYLNNSFRLSMPMMKRMLDMYEAGQLNTQQRLWFKAPRPVEELYDLQNDPYELDNLADNPAYQQEMNRLRTQYDAWDKTTNANWHRSEKEWMEIHWPGGVQPIVATPSVSKTEDGLAAVCTTPGSTICYKKDTTGQNWLIYTGPIKDLKKDDVVQILATRAGYKTSEIMTTVQ